ncbi:MAG: carbohydrate kinase [Methylococcaceae bacterium]|nr:carbohydrate kinase [Methylococcaceae bacterium]
MSCRRKECWHGTAERNKLRVPNNACRLACLKTTCAVPIKIFGEVLFDHFPNGATVLGGAPFNVAWHLHAFGQSPCFISRIGLDAEGESVIKAMQAWEMNYSELQLDNHYPTGAVQISFKQDEPCYQILTDQAYDFISVPDGSKFGAGSLLYHGTLALRNEVSRQALQNIKSQHQGKVFLDVNLREPWWRKDEILQWLGEADWVKLNREEFQALQPDLSDMIVAMKYFRQTHDLEGLIVTCGEQGAYAINMTGEQAKVVPDATVMVIDSVGAGDAFSAIAMLGIYLDWPLPLIMERAQLFASAMVGRQGATVQDKAFYQTFLASWLVGSG